MIRLLGVITQGGVPVQWRTSLESKGKLFITGMIEVVKKLSSMFGSGEVQMLEFEDDKLLVTESAKGFTVVALVSKAEKHLEGLIRIIAEELDEADIQQPGGSVTDALAKQVDSILERYLETSIDVELYDVLSTIWEPILTSLKQHKEHAKLITKSDQALLVAGREEEKNWLQFDRKTKGTLKEAIDYAFSGAFDYACAVAKDLETPIAKLFAIKTGLLALSMTRTRAPPPSVLKSIAETLYDSKDPFVNLVKAALGFRNQQISSEEYFKQFRIAAEQFQFLDDEPNLLKAILLVDPMIKMIPAFCVQMMNYFKDKSMVITTFLSTLLEQSNISSLYATTSYDQFKDNLGIWKTKIRATLENVALIIRPGLSQMQYLRKETEQRELGINESLNIQTYLELSTTLAKSTILALSERKEILAEIIRIYREYFRGLLRIPTPLFNTTIQSVFQSVSVAMAEYFLLITGKGKSEHIGHMHELLRDVVTLINDEWMKRQVDASPLFAVTNALCPILSMAGQLFDEEVQLTYIALRMTNKDAISKLQSSDPQSYAMILGCLLNTFATLAIKTMERESKTLVLQKCIEALIRVHKFLLSRCIICRDDVITVTYLVNQMIEDLPKTKQEPIIRAVFAMNRVVVPSFEKHGYEAAVIGEPLINLLIKSWKLLDSEEYYQRMKMLFDVALSAWRKYGFTEKATEFEKTFTALLES